MQSPPEKLNPQQASVKTANHSTQTQGASPIPHNSTLRCSVPQTIPKLSWYFACGSSQQLGVAGEIYAQSVFQDAGYIVRKSNRFNGDLLLTDLETGELIRVEVKTSRRNNSGYWQFNLHKQNHTNVKHADFACLLQVYRLIHVAIFIIPVSVLGDAHQVKIKSLPERYAGKYAGYLTEPVDYSTVYSLTEKGKAVLLH